MDECKPQRDHAECLSDLSACRKIQTGCLSAQFVAPLRRDTASYYALLPAVLNRGTMSCPDMEALSAATDRLYGADISPTVRKKGERQCVGFVASFIDDRYTLGGEKLLEPVANLMGELFLDPVTRGGRYLKEYVESERAIWWIPSGPSAMTSGTGPICACCRRCALPSHTASAVWGMRTQPPTSPTRRFNRHGQHLLSAARLELLYCGSADSGRVEEALLNAFAALPRARRRRFPICRPTLPQSSPVSSPRRWM